MKDDAQQRQDGEQQAQEESLHSAGQEAAGEEAAGEEAAAQEEDQQVDAQSLEEQEEELPELDETTKCALVEALILAHGEPITLAKIREISRLSEEEVRLAVENIEMRHSLDESGFALVNANGRFQFRTKGLFAPYVQKLKAGRPRRLSPPALETLAIVAYRQPIVKSDIEKIRGVDATPTLKTLLEKGFVRIVGHRDSVGQPALYGTTDKFLNVFGLRALSELPTLRDLQQFESDPGEVEFEDEESCHDDEEVSIDPEAPEEIDQQLVSEQQPNQVANG